MAVKTQCCGDKNKTVIFALANYDKIPFGSTYIGEKEIIVVTNIRKRAQTKPKN
jgi:hypothetical protein